MIQASLAARPVWAALMPRLKGVIFSLGDVIVQRGPVEPGILQELGQLLTFLRARGVTPVFVANHPWFMTMKDGTRRDLRDVLTEAWGEFPWYIAARGEMPWKPTAAAMQHVLKQQGWAPSEALYIGCTEVDMRTALHGGLLFLNAIWHGGQTPYGYIFSSPKEVGRFIDCFCLRKSTWFWNIERSDLRVYALGPYATRSPRYHEAALYSQHALSTAKHLGGDAVFWGRLLSSTIYLSGLADNFDYICSYPGHQPNSQKPVLNGALTILAYCLGKKYLGDLIVRHKASVKSSAARAVGTSVGHDNQLNTVHLNEHPIKNKKGDRYVRSPLRGKRVLVVDDICTQGNAFEAARTYLRATASETLCLSWLKAPSNDYMKLSNYPNIANPYSPVVFTTIPPIMRYYYNTCIVDDAAPADINAVFDKYPTWSWPT